MISENINIPEEGAAIHAVVLKHWLKDFHLLSKNIKTISN
jgi:hypothetical protein